MEKETKTTAETPPQTQPTPVGSQLPLTEVTADELAAPLAANMPEPTDSKALPPANEPAAATPQPAVNPVASSEVKDKAGNVWNPDRYKSGENGAPRTDSAGYFIPKNKGRPPKDPNAPRPVKSVMPESSTAQTPAPVVENKASPTVAGNGEQKPDEFDHAAELYFNMLIPLASGVISEEWLPGFNYNEKGDPFIDAKQAELEKKSITIPLAAYMRVKGKTELSPGWALTLAAVGYSGRRAQMPKTREKASSMFSTVKGWFGYGKPSKN